MSFPSSLQKSRKLLQNWKLLYVSLNYRGKQTYLSNNGIQWQGTITAKKLHQHPIHEHIVVLYFCLTNGKLMCRSVVYVPYYEPGDYVAEFSHDARIEAIQDLQRQYDVWVWSVAGRRETIISHQHPEENCDLEGVLEENNVDEDEDETRFVEPEMMIRRLHHKLPRYCYMPLSHFSC